MLKYLVSKIICDKLAKPIPVFLERPLPFHVCVWKLEEARSGGGYTLYRETKRPFPSRKKGGKKRGGQEGGGRGDETAAFVAARVSPETQEETSREKKSGKKDQKKKRRKGFFTYTSQKKGTKSPFQVGGGIFSFIERTS